MLTHFWAYLIYTHPSRAASRVRPVAVVAAADFCSEGRDENDYY